MSSEIPHTTAPLEKSDNVFFDSFRDMIPTIYAKNKQTIYFY